MKPARTTRAILRRRLCLEWILARRPHITKQPTPLWLVLLKDTPQQVARAIANGSAAEYAAQLTVITIPSALVGAAFAQCL